MNFAPVVHLLGAWALCFLMGHGAVRLGLPRAWQIHALLVTPVAGAGLAFLLSFSLSCLGLTLGTAAPVVAGLLLLSSLAVAIRHRVRVESFHSPRFKTFLWLNGLGLAAALLTLSSDILFGVWKLYSDAYSYVTVADGLIENPYYLTVLGAFPPPQKFVLWAFQISGHRMGINTLLAFFTVLFGKTYSFDMYNPVLALGVWVTVPSFFVMCRRTLLLPYRAAWWASLVFGLHAGIPIANAMFGFLPQAWGTGFLCTYLAAHASLLTSRESLRSHLGAAFSFAFLVSSYPELVPFALAGTGSFYFRAILRGGSRPRPSLVERASVPLLLGAMLAPVAAVNLKQLLRLARIPFGWDPGMSHWDHALLVTGTQALNQGGLRLEVSWPGPVLLVCVSITVVAVLLGLFAGPHGARLRLSAFSWPFVMAFVWYDFFVPNPWHPEAIGQPWSTYKALTYGFPFLAAAWGLGWSWLERIPLAKLVQRVHLAAFLAIALQMNWVTSRFLVAFGGSYMGPNLIDRGRLLAAVAPFPQNEPINLEFPPEAFGHRLTAAYFMRKPFLVDDLTDPNLAQMIPPAMRSASTDPRYPTLRYTRRPPHLEVIAGEETR